MRAGTLAALGMAVVLAGRWVIRAELTFTDGDGRGTYYWRVDVDGTGSS